jgi:hypothetical protein
MLIDWHRLFGVTLADVLTPVPFRVETEIELAKRKQRLDAAAVMLESARSGAGQPWPDLPAGLEDLAEHNLITFRSVREVLAAANMWELIAYFVSYAKQEWKRKWKSIAPDKVRLLAVSVHRPNWLSAEREPSLSQRTAGVYEIVAAQLPIRVIVPREVEETPQNAFWHLLSGDEGRIRFGLEHYQVQDPGLYNVLGDLKSIYLIEGIDMPYTKEDYKREVLAQYTPQERLEGLPVDELLQRMSPRERLQGLSPRDLLEGLDLLEGFSKEQLEALRRDLEEDAKKKTPDDTPSSSQ